MFPFPSINQFRNVVKHVQQQAKFKGLDADGNAIMDRAAIAPTLSFLGTVKLHGTNAAIVFRKDSVSFQSRERVIVPGDDNAGFAAHMSQHSVALGTLYTNLVKQHAVNDLEDHTIAVYGEWCGANIQKGVGITGLPKMFVIFAVRVNEEWVALPYSWYSGYTSASIYNIEQFPKWFMTIDFEKPEAKQNILGELTQQVEASCPVAKHFGQDGIGEGIVWRCVEHPSSDYWFKVKGEKHSASKVKTLAAVDVEAIENMNAFVASVVTDARLEQGLQNLINEQKKPFDITSMGDFIRWVYGDVLKEESDTIQANGLDPKKLGGPIALVARRWYQSMLTASILSPN